MDLAGVDDEVSFTRSKILNVSELITNLIQSGEYLPKDYVTRKILTLLGDGDKADDLIKEMTAEEMNAANAGFTENEEPSAEAEEEINE
jgi:hypothetical protein